MTTVLAALDSSASAGAVLSTATALAELYDSTVTCLHVADGGVSGAPELARAAGVEYREVDGVAADAIVAAALAADVAALVLGTRGYDGGPLPAGHTALAVITRLQKPVAVVPPRAHSAERITRILVPLEAAGAGSGALDETIARAVRHGLEIVVLHVHSAATVPAFSDHAPYAQETWEHEFLSRHISTSHDRVTLIRRFGVPGDDIVSVAGEIGVDVIVLSWRQDLSPGRARIVSETLAGSGVPILLLPMP